MKTWPVATDHEPTRRRSKLLTAARRLARYRSGSLVLLVLFALLIPVSNPRIYAVDEVGYYVYLRSLRFDGDLNFENEYRTFDQLNPQSHLAAALLKDGPIKDGGRRNPVTGLWGNVAPIGSALLWSPFFLLADLLVRLANAAGAHIPADGYSWPYVWSVCYASALYGFLGLLLCHRLACRFVAPFAATLATATVWLASPLVFYMFVQMPWSHATGLFVVACFLTLWHATRGRRSIYAWIALGLLGGLMTMVREQLVLFLVVPGLEGMVAYWGLLRGRGTEDGGPRTGDRGRGTEDGGPRIKTVSGLRSSVFGRTAALALRHCLFLIAFVVALVPQLAVYQILNGQMRPNTEVSGKFRDTWYSPCFFHTLIDPTPCLDSPEPHPGAAFAHGAFLWSPVLALGLVGLWLLWRRDKLLTAALLLAFLAQTFINGSIYTWHQTGAFGFRRLIECTPIFVLGLALLIESAQQVWTRRQSLVRGAALTVSLLLIIWNVGLIFNWTVGHTALRRGLDWQNLVSWQLDVPRQVIAKADTLLFNRCKLYQNQSCK